MKIKVTDFLDAILLIQNINNSDLNDIEIVNDYNSNDIVLAEEKIKEWKFIGLSNKDFLLNEVLEQLDEKDIVDNYRVLRLLRLDTDKTIEELDLTVRAYNGLKRHGINYVNELTELTEKDLMQIRNISIKVREEIKLRLEEIGLKLKEEFLNE